MNSYRFRYTTISIDLQLSGIALYKVHASTLFKLDPGFLLSRIPLGKPMELPLLLSFSKKARIQLSSLLERKRCDLVLYPAQC